MNNFNEDVKIPKEYFNISNIPIYHTEKKLHGIITGLKVRFSPLAGYYLEFESYFDKINSDMVIYEDDFITGKIKFVMIKNYRSLMLTPEEVKTLENTELNTIKAFMRENYTDDCILWISQNERDSELKEQEYRAKEKIGKEVEWAESATKDYIFDSWSARKILELYKNEVITEKQFLIELINILTNEKRAAHDFNTLGNAHRFELKMKNFMKNNEEIIEKMIKNANAENVGGKEENDNAEN